MPSRGLYLTRVNRALKDLGCAVAIEVAPSGKRLRLRSTLALPDGSLKQQRISTPDHLSRWIGAGPQAR
jgi:hypothetical protein